MSKKNNRRAAEQANAADSSTESQTNGTTEGTEPEAQAAPVDPFADVPTIRIGEDVEFDDLSAATVRNADPRKYATVHAAAVGDRLPTAKGWKHERAMLTPGSLRKEFKPGSVYGTIQAIVQAAGRGGVPAYVVATKLRRAQVGNKRSHYCGDSTGGALPPVGWAEGWINTAISKSIAGVHPTKQAPALRDEVTEGEEKVNAAEQQGKLAVNG
jgi:hypothetical protein